MENIQEHYIKILLLVSILYNVCGCPVKPPLLLLISFDGFRWDYIERANKAGLHTPNFDSLISSGVVIDKPGVTNSFITKTFPNHYTLVTGMYEENHGVVANNMFDPSVNKTFSIKGPGTEESFWFSNGSSSGVTYHGPMPIWNVNQLSGCPTNRRSGVMFWPGSEAPVDGERPFHYMKYDATLPNKTRINNVVGWFATEVEPINLGLLYFSEPDHLGHRVGPNSHAMMIMITELDELVGFLIQKLKEVHLFDELNIIITSDHGMAQTDHLISMDSYIDPNLYQSFGHSPIWNILPYLGKEDEVYKKLKKIPNLHVFWKENIPPKYHYTYNRRIMPIVIEAAEGYILCNDDTCQTGGGNHGYNNSLTSMHPFFIAHGPAFKKNYTARPFNNVDIFPLLCHILEVEIPSNVDGCFNNIKHILQNTDSTKWGTNILLVLVFAHAGLISAVCILSVWCIYRRLYKKRATRRTQIIKVESIEGPADGHIPLLLSSGEEDTVVFKE